MSPDRAARVLDVVSGALERAAEERPAFLEEACANDAELRAEVESLLEQEKHVGDFIEAPPAAVAARALAMTAEEPFVSRQFGAYQTIREIGRGGLGTVYLAARSDAAYRKEVAIKVIRRGLDTEDILHRFRNERQILAQLDHPNIARLLDGGTTGDGLPYFVMEHVQGAPIHTYCETHALGTTARLQLFRKVCAAVTYAHQNLVIHRDLKPSNIVVTAEGEPKLLDFGIAKLLTPEEELFTQTLPALRVMTPKYASPEQVKGERITTASDVYSLGVLFYQLLTGHLPYRLKTGAAEEIAHAITEQEPERPSTTAGGSEIRNLKSLKGDLDNIALMAMRKEPERRYVSAGQFSEDIRRHLEGLPVIARKDTVPYRASKFVSRHRLAVTAAALVMLSLVGGIVATLMQVRTARLERSKAEAISGFLQKTLNASNPNRNLSGQPTIKDVLDEASKRLATEELSDQPEVKAELQRIIGESYLSFGQYDLAQQNLTAALNTQTRIFGEDGIGTLKTGVSLAGLWAAARGDYAKASTFYLANLPRLRAEQKKGTIKADYLTAALSGFALLRRAQGDSKEAESFLREELALLPQVSPEWKNLGVVEAILALTLADQGKFAEAIKIVREKIAKIRQQTNEGSAELAASLTGLSSFLLENGQTGESLENLREAEAIYRKLFSAANLQLGDNIRLQAQALFSLGKYAEAEARIGETLRIYRAATSPQFVNYATALMVQGLIQAQTGRTDEAEKLLREAVRIRAANVPESHFLRATANGALGEFLTAQERFAEAEPVLLESHTSLQKSQAANSPRTRLALQRLVRLYEAWHKPDQAAPYRALLEAEAKPAVGRAAERGKPEDLRVVLVR